MTPEQVSVIKGYQKNYFDRFGERLEIDWLGMKGIKIKNKTSLEEYEDKLAAQKQLGDILNELVEKNEGNLEIIKTRRRLSRHLHPKEIRCIAEFSKIVTANRLNKTLAAQLINKDRTMINYYSNEE